MQAAQPAQPLPAPPLVGRPIETENGWEEVQDMEVTRVYVEAVRNHLDSSTPAAHRDGRNRLLHWRLSFCTYQPGRWGIQRDLVSVAVDTWKRPGDPDPRVATVVFSRRDDYWLSTGARFSVVLDITTKKFTTRDIKRLIEANHYHHYAFDPAWSGCLFWVRAVVALMVSKGLLATDSITRLDNTVELARGTRSMWVPEDRGCFFDFM